MIRALSVIGHGVDILPHFLTHYSEYVDEIQLVVYESDLHENLFEEVSKIVSNFPKGKIVKKIRDKVFDWEKVTSLYNFIKNNHPNDWWVIADVDEFHLYPNDDLKKIIDDCEYNGWSLIRGGFIDRIGPNGEFSELSRQENIFKQFPNMGFFRYPMSYACPNKVCIMKGNIEITSGQHYAKIDGHTTWKWQGWNHPLIAPVDFYSVQVHHFKWDSTSIERIRAVANIKQDYAYSNEYKLMFDKLRKTKFKIDIENPEFMFETSNGEQRFTTYKQWNKLIKKIISI
jgi:hypothetical protein